MRIVSQAREVRVQELIEHNGARYWRISANGELVRWDYDSNFMYMSPSRIEELEVAYTKRSRVIHL